MKLLMRHWSLVLLLALSIIPLFDLFHPGFPLTHDGQDHLARIANFYQSLSEGNIIPRWAANLNWGYGHPVLMFLYPLPSYFASLFHLFGFSLADSLKIVFGITFLLSGLTMYLWVRNLLGQVGGLVAGILYVYAPYRFVDLYVRGAIGEHVAFVFPPLILYFLLKLSQKVNYLYVIGGALSIAGLILSHNAITIMFLPFIFLYAFYLILKSKTKKVVTLLFSLIFAFGFGLSSFFLLPAYFEGKYTLRDIVTQNEYASRFVSPDRFIYSKWNYGGSETLSVMIGFIQLAGLLVTPLISYFLYKRREIILFQISILFFLYTIISLFLMLSQSNFLYLIFTILQKFQFPWRFMSTVVFSTAFLSALFIYVFKKPKIQFVVSFIIILFAVLFSVSYWRANDYSAKPDSFYKNIYYGTTDTGESAPIWSVRFMERQPLAHIEIIEGNAQIKEIKRLSNEHIYEITALSKTRIRENTLFFPGWNVYINGKKNDDIEFQDPLNRGLITFFVPPGKHSVFVRFEETKLREISNNITLLSAFGLLAYVVYSKAKNLRLKIKKTR